jgi:hypothetical protein
MILAPFQKQTQIEFANVKIKEEAVRFLTVINPLDKPRQVNNLYYLFSFFFLLCYLKSINCIILVCFTSFK